MIGSEREELCVSKNDMLAVERISGELRRDTNSYLEIIDDAFTI